MTPSTRSSNRRWSAAAAAALTVCLGLATPARAQSDDIKSRAAQHVQQGQKYQRVGQFDAAIAEYEQAYALVPHPELLFNLAQAHRLNGDAAQALGYYRKYLAVEPDGRGADKAREYVGLLEEVVAKQQADAAATAEAAQTAPPSDRSSSSRGRAGEGGDETPPPADTAAPVEPAPMLPGDVEPASDPVSVSVSPVEPRDDGGDGGLRIAGLATAGVGLVCVGLGVKFGLDASSISDELSAHDAAWTDELLARQDEGESAENKMLVLTGVGAAAIVAGGVMYVLGMSGGGGAERPLAIAPHVSADGAGLAIGGRF